MDIDDMADIAMIIVDVLSSAHPVILTKGEHAGEKSKVKAVAPKKTMELARKRVGELLKKYPVYPEIDLEWLKEEFIGL